MRSRLEGRLGHGLAAQPSPGGGPRHAETGRAPCALTVRSPHAARAPAGTVTRSMAARWGLAGGKVLPTRTSGVPGWRWAGGGEVGLTLAAARREGRSGGSGAEAVADVGEEKVPVSDGVVLWLEVEAREVVVARCQSGEGKMRCGGENLAGDGVFILKGSGGEGGRRGGCRVEAVRHGAVWRSGVGLVAAQPRRARAARCRVIVEGGGVGATRDGVANRWAGMPRGPGRQRLGAA
jgi:hypothetical protein